MTALLTQSIHPSWQKIVSIAFNTLDLDYVKQLEANADWLPNNEQVFNAFRLPFDQVKVILFGESPYPRAQSANGYAFWDAAVGDLWSEKGLSKAVNRATSLRNFIKMLLVSENLLSANDTSQQSIAACEKKDLVTSNHALFTNIQSQGILLLNSTLVLSQRSPSQEAKYWQPFMQSLLESINHIRDDITLLLFGNIAKRVQTLPAAQNFHQIVAEHPYNLSFIKNEKIIHFFRPMNLLRKINLEQEFS